PGIESCTRFIQQQNLWCMQQAFGNLDPAFQTTGETFCKIPCSFSYSKLFKHDIATVLQGLSGESVQVPLMNQVLPNSQLDVQTWRLKGDTNQATNSVRITHEIQTAEFNSPFLQRHQGRQD